MSAPRLKAILVSTLGLEPELFLLTTGTFNLFVKDRITLRLSAVNSVQTRTHECASVCPRNLSKTKCSVTLLSTHCGHRISTRFSQRRTRGFTSLASPLEMWSFLGGDRTGLPPIWIASWRSLKAEVSCLEKDLLEVLAKTRKPFEDHCPRMQIPWPGSISEVLMLC
jgi:hypothetical protein